MSSATSMIGALRVKTLNPLIRTLDESICFIYINVCFRSLRQLNGKRLYKWYVISITIDQAAQAYHLIRIYPIWSNTYSRSKRKVLIKDTDQPECAVGFECSRSDMP